MNQPRIAFLFPGQGSQAVGMGRDLAERFPVARQTFEEADAALGFSLSALCFEGPEEQLRLTEYTQPAIFTVSVAALRVLKEHEIVPGFAAGHSLGEYSANVAAGSMPFAETVSIVRNRGRYMQDAVPPGKGAMAAILGLSAELTAAACEQASSETGELVSAANLNSPEQIVISGSVSAVERAAALAKERGAKRAVMLPVSAPFHCAYMQPAQDKLAELLHALPFSPPQIPIAVNVDAAMIQERNALRDALIRQVTGAVRWVESMRLLVNQEPAYFIEVGPGRVLCGLMRQIDRGQRCLNVEDSASLEKTLNALRTEAATA